MLTFLRLGFALVSVVPAALATLLARSPAAGVLGPRQYCPPTYGLCSSDVGYTLCLAPDEYCCQFAGVDPFTCPSTNPYCCPGLLCGSTSDCSGPVIDAPTSAQETAPATATATRDITVTKAATAAPTAGGPSKPNGAKTGGASSVAMGFTHDPALIAAAVGLLVAVRMALL